MIIGITIISIIKDIIFKRRIKHDSIILGISSLILNFIGLIFVIGFVLMRIFSFYGYLYIIRWILWGFVGYRLIKDGYPILTILGIFWFIGII
jgi:hypothetical protein